MPLRSVIPLLAVLYLALGASLARADHSNSLMDVSPDGRRLLVANPDNGTVSVVDVPGRKKLSEISVGEKPEGVTWIGGSRLAAVTVYRDAKVVFVDADAGKVVGSMPVAAEPYGIVATKDGTRLFVTHEYPGLVSEIDVVGRKVLRELKAGNMVRGLCLSPDEKRLYVTEFYTARLLALDRESGKVVDTWVGHAADNLSRNVVVHPTRPKAYLSHIRSRVEIIDGSGSIFPHVSVCDLVTGTGKRRTSLAMDTYNGVYVVTNPWESALSPDGKRLYTVYAGTNDMNISDVIDDDYREIERHGRAVTVGKMPRAVRVSPDGKTVFIYNTLDFQVGFYDAEMHELTRDQGVSAAEDAGVGARQDPVQHGAAAVDLTALDRLLVVPSGRPQRWPGVAQSRGAAQDDGPVRHGAHASAALVRRPRRGAGFRVHHSRPSDAGPRSDRRADQAEGRLPAGRTRGEDGGPLGRPRRAGDLLQFVRVHAPVAARPGRRASCRRRPSAARRSSSTRRSAVRSATAGRITPIALCKSRIKLHDVGTGMDDPSEKMGPKYKTPTLLGVYRTAPYLHHGKAATLAGRADDVQQGGQAREDKSAEAGAARGSGGVSEGAAVRIAAIGDAEYGKISGGAGEEGRMRSLTGRLSCQARFRGWIRILKIRRCGRVFILGFINELRNHLNSRLPEAYIADVGERVYVVESNRDVYPDNALFELPWVKDRPAKPQTAIGENCDPPLLIQDHPVEVREAFIEIRSVRKDRHLIGVIEVLSPINKYAGEGREAYLKKQQEVLSSSCHLIEIDLLRRGPHTVAVQAFSVMARNGPFNYIVCLHRAGLERKFETWPLTLRQRLPRIAVPLVASEPDVILDLQEPLDRVYDLGKYGLQLDYTQAPPAPVLAPADAAWADALLREHKRRP